MALASLGSLASGFHKASASSWSTLTTSQAIDAGDFVLLGIATDNLGAADAFTNTHTAVTIGGVALSKIGEGTKGAPGIGNGATLSVWQLVFATPVPAGSVVACTFSAAMVAKALAAQLFSTSGPGAQVVMDGGADGFTLTSTAGIDEDNTGQTRRERLYWVFNAVESVGTGNTWNPVTTNPATGGVALPFAAAATSGGSGVTNMRLAACALIGTFDKVTCSLSAAITGDAFYLDGSMYEIPAVQEPQTYPRTATDGWGVSSTATMDVGLYLRGSGDGITITDAVAGTPGQGRPSSDSWSVNDSAARTPAPRVRPVVDTVTVSDSAGRAPAALTRPAVDAIVFSDSAIRVPVTRPRTAFDTVVVSDKAAKPPAIPPSAYDQEVLNDNPIVYWPLDDPEGSTTARDLVENVGPATLRGGTGQFDGSTVHLDSGTTLTVDRNTAGFDAAWGFPWPVDTVLGPSSIETWVTFDTAVSIQSMGLDAYGSPFMNFADHPAYGGMAFQVFGNTGITSPGIPSVAGKEYHLVGTYDGTVTRFYVNGIPVGSGACTGTSRLYGCQIGSRPGRYSRAAFYDYALSPARVREHYLTGTNAPYMEAVLSDTPALYWRLGEPSGTIAHDATDNNRDGTISGATFGPTGLLGVADNALTFDGVDDTASSSYQPFLAGAVTRTFEVWAKRTDQSIQRALFGTSGGGGSNGRLIIAAGSNDVSVVTGTGVVRTWAGAWPGLNVSTHVVLVVTSNRYVELFINGVSKGQLDPGSNFSGTQILRLGSHGNFSEDKWTGVLDEFAVYESALTPERIAAHYDAGTYTGPISLTATAADTVVVSDTTTRVPATRIRPAADAFSVNDAAGRLIGRVRPVADNIVISDSAVRAPATRVRPVVDTVVVSDQAGRAPATRVRPVSDVVAVSDTAARPAATRVRPVADVVTITDEVEFSQQGNLVRSVTDTVVVNSTATRAAATRIRPIVDIWVVTDSAGKVLTRPRTATDAWSVSDTSTGVKVIARTATDMVVTSDVANRAAATRTRPVVDAVTITDTALRAAVTRIRPTADAWSVTDAAAGVNVIVRLVGDVVLVSDQAARAPVSRTLTATDSFVINDAVVRAPATRTRPVADSWTITDVVVRTRVSTRGVTDSWTISDSIQRTGTRPRAVSDLVLLSDSASRAVVVRVRVANDFIDVDDVAQRAARALVRGTTDVVLISDSTSSLPTKTRVASDTVTLSDYALRPAIDFTRTADDYVEISDTARGVQNGRMFAAADDTLEWADAAYAVILPKIRGAEDNVVFSDDVTRIVSRPDKLSVDSVTISDTAESLPGKTRLAFDAINLFDQAARNVSTFIRPVSDSILVTDSAVGGKYIVKTALDQWNISDIVAARVLSLGIYASDVVILSDYALAKRLDLSPPRMGMML
jgi:hypothetical protein